MVSWAKSNYVPETVCPACHGYVPFSVDHLETASSQITGTKKGGNRVDGHPTAAFMIRLAPSRRLAGRGNGPLSMVYIPHVVVGCKGKRYWQDFACALASIISPMFPLMTTSRYDRVSPLA
jgi:hypothetical protein